MILHKIEKINDPHSHSVPKEHKEGMVFDDLCGSLRKNTLRPLCVKSSFPYLY